MINLWILNLVLIILILFNVNLVYAQGLTPQNPSALTYIQNQLYAKKDVNLSIDLGRAVYFKENKDYFSLVKNYEFLDYDLSNFLPLISVTNGPKLFKGILADLCIANKFNPSACTPLPKAKVNLDPMLNWGNHQSQAQPLDIYENSYMILNKCEPNNPIWLLGLGLIQLYNSKPDLAINNLNQYLQLSSRNISYDHKVNNLLNLAKQKQSKDQETILAERARRDAQVRANNASIYDYADSQQAKDMSNLFNNIGRQNQVRRMYGN